MGTQRVWKLQSKLKLNTEGAKSFPVKAEMGKSRLSGDTMLAPWRADPSGPSKFAKCPENSRKQQKQTQAEGCSELGET